MEDKDVDKGKFLYGFLLSIPAYLLSSVVLALVFAIGSNQLNTFVQRIIPILSVGLIIWVPLSLIAGNISKTDGKKSATIFVVASFFISLLVIGGCTGMFTQLGGSEPNITEPTSPSTPSYR